MTRINRLSLSLALVFISAGSPKIADARSTPGVRVLEATNPQINAQAISFFVAKGPPNSCGPGCDEWIAAEGSIDLEAHNRFSKFLSTGSRRKLPVYFHSQGGYAEASRRIGEILRGYRMTVAVGQTVPSGCGSTIWPNENCRRIMRSSSELKAHLYPARGVCNSACVYAFLGGSVRQLPQGAAVGVHSVRTQRQSDMKSQHNVLRPYLLKMGVDPSLIDLVEKFPPSQIRYLTREELARFGIVPNKAIEFDWVLHHDSSAQFFVEKVFTRASSSRSGEYLTTLIGFECQYAYRIGSSMYVSRELDSADRGGETTIRISSDDADVWTSTYQVEPSIRVDRRITPMAIEVLLAAAKSKEMRFVEETAGHFRETKLSNRGLLQALEMASSKCKPVKIDPLTIHHPIRN